MNNQDKKPIRSVRMTDAEWKIVRQIMTDPEITKQFKTLGNLLTKAVINLHEQLT